MVTRSNVLSLPLIEDPSLFTGKGLGRQENGICEAIIVNVAREGWDIVKGSSSPSIGGTMSSTKHLLAWKWNLAS